MSLALAPRPVEKLTPLERLEVLCDADSLHLIRSDVMSARMGAKARAGDGVVAGAGRVDGRPVYCYAQDPSYLGGSLGEMHADTIVRVLRLADRAGAPVSPSARKPSNSPGRTSATSRNRRSTRSGPIRS